jgi:hypothetical protein
MSSHFAKEMLASLLLVVSTAGCFSGDAILPTEQRAQLTLLSAQTNRPLAGVEVIAASQSGYGDQPRPISPNDQQFLDHFATAQPEFLAKTTDDGSLVLRLRGSSDPGFFGIGRQLYDATGKNWGFRLRSGTTQEYLTIFPMGPGATGQSRSFILRVASIGEPVKRR